MFLRETLQNVPRVVQASELSLCDVTKGASTSLSHPRFIDKHGGYLTMVHLQQS